MDLGAVEKTIRISVGYGKRLTSRFEIMKGLVDAFPDVELEKDISAVWRMESPFVLYVTFKHKACAEYLDSVGEYCHNNKQFLMSACDRRRLIVTVSWIPIWAGDHLIAEQLKMFGVLKSIYRERIDGVQTGVRLVSCTIRENEMDKFPYSVTIDGKTGLVTVPGRPPKCFRCNILGHIRSECPYSITSVNPSNCRRTYANAVGGTRNLPLTGGDGVRDSDPRQNGKQVDLQQVGAEGGNEKSGPRESGDQTVDPPKGAPEGREDNVDPRQDAEWVLTNVDPPQDSPEEEVVDVDPPQDAEGDNMVVNFGYLLDVNIHV